MTNNTLADFNKLTTAEAEALYQREVLAEGFAGFRRLLDSLTEAIKAARDTDMETVAHAVAKAKRLFPEPLEFSPSWENIWPELESTIAAKTHIFTNIPPGDRVGEWQVIMDNPLVVQEVVCYPALSFEDAAYLYAYFRPQLEKSEYIRLQKIQTVIQEIGG
ncbi:hypothetical protein A8709_02110 [Paenibacillus pectinilyticus]|uniref:Uncharacterized protein n=1 Tax=Paenibacillus pectinilyticus TaxID=512399 RepID=A0A1C1A6R7_9BACL|nr:hypothetical protein [Paenibacillus pectinilyticus]OCT16250.1 hypothetical protein A8709_02110 [Paenibacillus pectinilyticus]